jgi:hypothetical protein
MEGKSASNLVTSAKREVLEERAPAKVLKQLINLLLVIIHQDIMEASKVLA